MNIAVCIKQVPAFKADMDFSTGTLIRKEDQAVMNPYDKFAIEAALMLKEKLGGQVTAFSMGPPSAGKVLREAFSVGADTGILITDPRFSGSDAYATARTLSLALQKSGPYDIIVCGRQTTDGDTAQVGPEIAALLNIPFCCWVTSIDIDTASPNSIIVRQRISEGRQTAALPFPCLVTVDKDIGIPRLPTAKSKLTSKKTPVRQFTSKDFPEVDTSEFGQNGSPTKVSKLYTVSYERKGVSCRCSPEAASEWIHAFMREKKIGGVNL